MGILSWFNRSERSFNQASRLWRRRQQFLLEGEQERAKEAAFEVVRLCQLAVSASQKNGDAYVLLANALLSASSDLSWRSDPERYEFVHSRAAAVIHMWYSLPHRGYPITKNTAIGERLWRITVDGLMESRELSQDAALGLMDSYRDGIAADTISPTSLEQIREVILGTA